MDKPKLSQHKKAGDTLETPLLAGNMGKIMKLTSWRRDSLPEYFWIALVFDKYGREKGLEIFSKILEACKQNQLCESKFSVFTNLSKEKQSVFYNILDRNIDKDTLAPLTIIIDSEKYPFFFKHYVNPAITISEKISTIMRVVENNMNMHDEGVSDICFIVLWFMVVNEKLVLGYNMPGIGEALKNYHHCKHSDAKMRMYRPAIRATFQAISQLNPNIDFCVSLWSRLAQITPCKPLIINFEKEEVLHMQFYEDVKKVIEFIQASAEEKKLEKQFEVCMGITMYIVKLYKEIVENNLFCTISGRIIFRTMVESYFNMKYLMVKGKDDSQVYEMFQEYGRGKYKLVMSKLREKKFTQDDASHINKDVMEIYVNEEKDENFLNISLNFFDKQNLRQKVKAIDENELYEIYYEYDTSYVHGFWGAIRESSMLICDNPAHMYHTVPDYTMEQTIFSIADDCEMLIKKVFVLLSDVIELPDFYTKKY